MKTGEFFHKIKSFLLLFTKTKGWVPLLVFVLFYILHFWLTLTSSDVLYGGPGDHTAGLIWLYDNSPSTPWWNYTDASGYPWGDDLWSPLFITGQIGYVLFWIFSKVLGGAVAGYNAYILLGLAASYTVGYLFIYKRYVKHPLVASLFALLLIASPAIFAIIAVGHPSYVFTPLYVLSVLWLTIKVLEVKSWKLSILLGVIIGSTVFFDPYFVLMIPTLAAIFFTSLIIFNWKKIRQDPLMTLLKKILLVIAGTLIVVAPALIYIVSQFAVVSSISSSSRSPIREDAYAYSADSEDYVLPAAGNPLALPLLKDLKLGTPHGSDPTFTLYLGLFVLTAVTISFIWWLRLKAYKDQDTKKLAMSILVVAGVAFIFSLPPTVNMFEFDIPMPSWVITHFASVWRVFARFYFIVQPLLILFLAITVSAYVKYANLSHKKRQYVYIIVIGLIVLTLVDYLPRNPFQFDNFWDYNKDLPISYQELKRDNYKVIAEYPMREQPYYKGSVYLTGQHIHNKKMVNAYSPTNTEALVRLNLIDLNNPQTIPVLRYMGVDTLVVWNSEYQTWDSSVLGGVRMINEESYVSKFGKNNIVLYKIEPGTKQRYLGFVEKGYRPDESALYDIGAPLHNGVRIGVMDLCPVVPSGLSCKDEDIQLHLRGSIYNDSNEDVAIKIKDQAGSVREEFVLKGFSSRDVNLKTDIESYTVEFDTKHNDKVLYKGVHVVEN